MRGTDAAFRASLWVMSAERKKSNMERFWQASRRGIR